MALATLVNHPRFPTVRAVHMYSIGTVCIATHWMDGQCRAETGKWLPFFPFRKSGTKSGAKHPKKGRLDVIDDKADGLCQWDKGSSTRKYEEATISDNVFRNNAITTQPS